MMTSAQTLLADAREARRQGRFDAALAAYDALLSEAPGNLTARIERAATLSQGRRMEDAAAAIAAVLADAPDHPSAHMEAGFIARGQGRHEDELTHFEAAAAGAADATRALIQLATAALRLGRVPRALEAARVATETAPGLAAAWIVLAQVHRAAGDTAAEQDALRQAMQADPDDPAPMMELANAALRAGDPRAALGFLDEAASRSPPPPLLDIIRGHAALAAGEMDLALDAFREGVARNPTVVAATAGLIHCLLRRNDHDRAEAVIDEAKAAFGDRPELLAQRAALLQAEGRLVEARELLRTLHATATAGRFERWQAWMDAELRIGTPEEQAACILAAQPATPAEAGAVARAEGQSAEARYDFMAAEAAYGRALAAVAEDAVALDGMARLAALHMRHQEALDWLKRQADVEAAQRAREGRSRNPSQTTAGQVAIEFRLDRDGSAVVREVMTRPPAERIAPLAEAARAMPGSTAVALWLLISLRQAGRLEEVVPGGAGPIPRRLLWLRTREDGAEARRVARWRAVNPAAEVVELDGRAAVAFLAERYGDAGRAAWARTPEPEVRANLVRLAWLAGVGGWSAAPGRLAVVALPGSAEGGPGFWWVQGEWGAPETGMLGAVAGDAVAVRAAGLAVEALARGDMEHPWLRCGPGLLARAVCAGAQQTVKEARTLAPSCRAAMPSIEWLGDNRSTTVTNERTCVIIDATEGGEFELFCFDALKKALNGIVDVFLVLNEAEAYEKDNILSIPNNEIFESRVNFKKATSMIPGNPDVKLFTALQHEMFSPYSKFVRLEFDCIVSHPIAQVIKKILERTADVDVAFVGNYRPEASPAWQWWRTFSNHLDSSAQAPGPIRGGMLQIFVFNRKFEEEYLRVVAEGWTAHYEVLIPTIASWSGLRTLDLVAARVIDLAAFSAVPLPEIPENKSMIIHPVKDFSTFMSLPALSIREYIRHSNVSPREIAPYKDIRMTAGEVDLFRRYLKNADRYLEFGSGGSTSIACTGGPQYIWSIETDDKFLLSIEKKYELRRFIIVGRLHLLHIDIGRTGSWGTPLQPYTKNKWSRYTELDWSFIRADLVLVDARFRVACAARSYIEYHGNPRLRVLVHDYTPREHYHALNDIFDVEQETESLSALRARPDKLSVAKEIYEHYKEDFR
jgi:tetratricopeptide (TPR) repeat protein